MRTKLNRPAQKKTEVSVPTYVPPVSGNVHKRLMERAIREAVQYEVIEARERLFEVIVTEALLERLEDDLYEQDFPNETIDIILDTAVGYSYEDISRALCYPYDPKVRETFFRAIRRQVEAGILKKEDVLSYMAKIARGQHVGIGFHMSPTPITPRETPSPIGVQKVWGFIGRESDHRDSDLSRAYYSRSFNTLFRRGTRNYMYIARVADTDDNDGTWWRSGSLSIIAEIPVQKLDAAVRALQEELGTARDNNTSLRDAAE